MKILNRITSFQNIESKNRADFRWSWDGGSGLSAATKTLIQYINNNTGQSK